MLKLIRNIVRRNNQEPSLLTKVWLKNKKSNFDIFLKMEGDTFSTTDS